MQKTQEMRTQSMGGADTLEQEMATHASIPAWKIPWREEPDGLNSPWDPEGWTQWSD